MNKFVVFFFALLMLLACDKVVKKPLERTTSLVESGDSGCSSDSVGNPKIIDSGFWKPRIETGSFSLEYCVVPVILKDELITNGEKLSIVDEEGTVLFNEDAVSIGDIEIRSILGSSKTQFIIRNLNFGGSGRFLKILDFDGKQIVDLTEHVDTLHDGLVEIVPDYKTGRPPIRVPYKVLLTSPNLAAPRHSTRIIKFQDDRYVLVGEYPREVIDMAAERYIEQR